MRQFRFGIAAARLPLATTGTAKSRTRHARGCATSHPPFPGCHIATTAPDGSRMTLIVPYSPTFITS